MRRPSKRMVVVLVLGVAMIAALAVLLRETKLGIASTWQRMASPGRLSKTHAFLENNCAACHTAVKGPEANNCIVCHANNKSLLGRQPTAFHANIGSCRECHIEHQGLYHRPTAMDHLALSRIGMGELKDHSGADSERELLRKQIESWIQRSPHSSLGTERLRPQELVLNCATCHANDDRHFKLFGQDCAQCHSTKKWTIPEFRHPASGSRDCAQCHLAPPSHFMGHFHMVSAKVAGKPHAKVSQCYACHKTTSWNDIVGVGWYKHH